MILVKSSNIEGIGYHQPKSTLHIIFRDGGHYAYDGVRPGTFFGFMQARSKGQFFHTVIKGRYQHTKIK